MLHLLKISRAGKGEQQELLQSYELRPINLFNLTENQAATVLDHFVQFLKSLNERIVFRIVEDERRLCDGGEEYLIPYKRYFVSSTSDLSPILPFLGTRFSKANPFSELKLLSATSRYWYDEAGVARVYNVTKLGGAAHPGFLTSIYPIAHEVRVEIIPLSLTTRGRRQGPSRFQWGRRCPLGRARGGTWTRRTRSSSRGPSRAQNRSRQGRRSS